MGKRRVIAFSLLMLLLVFCSNNIPYLTYSNQGNGTQHSFSGHAATVGGHVHGGYAIGKPTIKKEHVRVRYMGGESCYVLPAFFEQHAPRTHHVQVHDHFRIVHITVLPYVSITLRGPPHPIACIS